MACGEFSLVARYSDRIRGSRFDAELDVGDDRALLNIPKKQTPAISADMLVAGNHFLPDIDPADLAYKALAVNLSDPTAMGADLAQLTPALTLSNADETRLESLSDSLFDLLNYYDMQLIGGDTTCGPLSMTLGIHGFIPVGRALAYSEARPGDWIRVTDTPGDSVAGLAILQNRLQAADAKDADYLIRRRLRPSPRTLQRQALRDLANSAIDLPDGLISDLRRIVKASDCDARIDLALLPFSDVPSRHVEPEQALRWASSGGEDYELCFTVSELNRGVLDVVLGYLGTPFTCIGQMTTDIEGLYFIRDGELITLGWKRYDHLATS